MSKCDDIIDLHAPLIHKAADVQFQTAYDNGGTPATVIDINHNNTQKALESYFSQVGVPIKNELPTGTKNSINLTFITASEFIPATLEVFLSGVHMNPGTDFDIISTGPNANKSFILKLAPNDANRLNVPPFQDEPLTVNYGKRITFDTKGGT